jgi:predicted RND superfamily exporter protein
MFGNLLAQYARWVVRHRWTVLGAVALVTLLLGRAAGHLHVEVDPDRLLPQQHEYIRALNRVHSVFGDKNLVVVGLFPNDGRVFTPAFLGKLADVTARIEAIPGANRALVQSVAAAHVKDIRGTADGMEVTPLMEAPPTDQAGADAVRARVFANPAYVGTLVSADGSAAAIQASFELTPELPDYRTLNARIVQTLDEAEDGSFRYVLAGPIALVARLAHHTARIALFFPLALLVIGLVHYDAFRTLQGLFLPLVTALLAVFWAIGLMGLLGIPFDPYNVSTPILILAVGAGHAVQVLKRFYEEYERKRDVEEAIVEALGRVGPVMVAAGMVATLSFCSLATFDLATIRTFGLLTGFGIFSALVIELTVIPALRAMLPPPRLREREREAAAHPWLDALLDACHRRAVGGARNVVVSAGLLLVVCGLLAMRIRVDNSYRRTLGADDPVRVGDAEINAQFAGTNTFVLLVEGDAEGTLEEPAIMDAIAGLERRLELEPGVGTALSYVDFVRRMHHAMNADRDDVGDLPDSRALAAQYLFLFSLSGGGQSLDTLIDPAHRIAKVRVLSHEDSTAAGDRLMALARQVVATTFPPGYRVEYTGSLASTSALTQVMVAGKIRNILQIACIIFGISALLLRSLAGGLLVTTPLALAVAVNFGVMGLLDVPLDTNTATIAAIAVGIGADYAIYFLFRLREEVRLDGDLDAALRRALMTSGKAVLFVSSAIAAGYLTLCFSGFVPYLRVGALVSLAMVVSSGATLVLLPALIVVLQPAFLWRGVRAVPPPFAEEERIAG